MKPLIEYVNEATKKTDALTVKELIKYLKENFEKWKKTFNKSVK